MLFTPNNCFDPEIAIAIIGNNDWDGGNGTG